MLGGVGRPRLMSARTSPPLLSSTCSQLGGKAPAILCKANANGERDAKAGARTTLSVIPSAKKRFGCGSKVGALGYLGKEQGICCTGRFYLEAPFNLPLAICITATRPGVAQRRNTAAEHPVRSGP